MGINCINFIPGTFQSLDSGHNHLLNARRKFKSQWKIVRLHWLHWNLHFHRYNQGSKFSIISLRAEFISSAKLLVRRAVNGIDNYLRAFYFRAVVIFENNPSFWPFSAFVGVLANTFMIISLCVKRIGSVASLFLLNLAVCNVLFSISMPFWLIETINYKVR